jgi:nitrite reductase/ring-hydroxylating ferredoxin subunit
MSQSASPTWHKIADSLQDLHFGQNQLAEIQVEGKKYCVGRHPQGLFAFAYTCPHAGANLIEGNLNALGQVICPLHHYKFCIKTGRNISGEGYYLRHWPVELREDGVYMGGYNF